MYESDDRVMNDEKWTRFAVNLAHGIGGSLFTAFGGGAAVQPLGDLENQAIDAGFASRHNKKIEKLSPAPTVNDRAREVASSPPPQTTMFIPADQRYGFINPK